MAKRKPPPEGFERHPIDPNLVRKIIPKSAGAAMYPYLPSEDQRREKERLIEKARRKGR